MSEQRLKLRDGAYVARLLPFMRLAVKLWFRSEVHGMEKVPDGGALIVSNHSGGMVAMDVPIIAVAFHDQFGVDRPLYVLAHDMLFMGQGKDIFPRAGFLPATRENAEAVLRSGGVTIVFPGGDYDVFRPTTSANRIDFNGRTGYVRTAIETGAPIVPVVSIGGQEAYLFFNRGEQLARLLRLEKLLRTRYMPLTFGFPFGFTFGIPPNLPLPTKIETRVLDPIHVTKEFGDDPDVAEVDRAVRERMQNALDEMARARRFPVLG
ncbi:MAG: Lysophospholipid Acyltransferases (LPLATs) of Glycerophospholipid Biosynthesis: MGAT-like [uncultured Nocardioidaceae bacterium]|uniref:Lysophospholipid Acyltransferases (LPLATs) of Glycerophospholipid Biosynthesis: MGAT-like n=1 Tax=uncultured Nocardioidaceae bacterium TaxID=253824 RepID=A0A6J4NWT4_9ACTN|nr:MAG: Lysophospholipid Acyltransferases (LPLATs) of Glycerophospholipid Biosynthesis: MGAT-like [uncultured Nocardioidaceae bacterium]